MNTTGNIAKKGMSKRNIKGTVNGTASSLNRTKRVERMGVILCGEAPSSLSRY